MEPKPVSLAGEKDSFIVFRNSQGNEGRGTLLRLARQVAAFEVYNPYSIVQLSEVLSDLQIFMTDRLVYSGRGVVSSLVNTGIMLICEATLDEAWLDVDIFSPLNQLDRLSGEFAEFLRECDKVHTILPAYKVAVADVQTFFVDVRRWLEQVELGIRSSPTGDREAMHREVIDELRSQILPPINQLFGKFEEVSLQIDKDLQPLHRTYVKRQLHPHVLCAPFAYRTYQKPLGYAGDYEMVNMILGDPHQGGSLFAKMLNVWLLQQPSAQAHRNRVKFLTSTLAEEVTRVVRSGRRAKVLNLGCGPAGEIQAFLAQHEVSSQADFTLLDFNDETIAFARKVLTELKQVYRRDTGLTFENRSVNQILKECLRRAQVTPESRHDLIYCAGLFDYLTDRACSLLLSYFYDLVAPGGLIVATNVDACNPNRSSMDFILEWHLEYRDQKRFAKLAPDQASPEHCRVSTDPTAVNIFLEVRKPYAP